jgi:hypothetical protein
VTKRTTFLLAALASALMAYVAFALGAWAFGARRWVAHDTRLRHLVQQQPTMDRVTRGLADEGMLLVAAPRTPAEVRRAVEELAGPRAPAILEKARAHPQTRVYQAGDMIYFLFFDAEDVLRDYAYVSR